MTGIHLAMHRNIFAAFFRKRFAVPLIIVLTIASLYGVTFIGMDKWLSAPFTPDRHSAQRNSGGASEKGRGSGGHQHKEEPFNPVAVFEVMAGVFSVVLLVNAGEYVVERLATKR
ncbi:MAG: hypothetical protein IJR63_10535 [Synergistaceae bacterium]|nr:hypothetical protein [Synergistaceae bacterium]